MRLKPLFLFWICYTAGFFLFAVTLKYTFPFLAGFLLALLAQPLINWLKRRLRVPPAAAAAAATLLVYAVLFGILFLIGYWLILEISNLISYMSGLSEQDLGRLSAPLSGLIDRIGKYLNSIDAGFIAQNQEKILNLTQTGVGVLLKTLSTALGFLTSLPAIFTMFIVMIFSTYFFSKDMKKIKSSVLALFTSGGADDLRAYSKSGRTLGGRYIGSYLFIYFLTFLETLVVFFVLGVPYPLVLSLITGIADILPVLGPGIIYLPLAFGYFVTGNFFNAGALAVCWLIVSAIRQVIEPKIVSSSINIHPLSMLAAIYFALIARNFWVLIYFSLMMVLYQMLVKAGQLPPLSGRGAKRDPDGGTG